MLEDGVGSGDIARAWRTSYIHLPRDAMPDLDLPFSALLSIDCVIEWLAGCVYLPNAICDHGGRQRSEK